MDLNGCLAFVTVLECGSFSAAGRRLGVPRSTVSARVAALESRLGTRLLRRTTRRVGPTDDGRVYFEQVAPAIRAIRDAEANGLASSRALSGSIRISVPLDFPVAVLSDALVSFQREHVRVSFDIVVDNDVNDFVADNIDLAIRGGAPGSGEFVAKQIASFRFGRFASPEYLRRHGRTHAHGEVLQANLRFEGRFRGGNLALPNGAMFSPERSIATNSFALLRQLVLDGAGVAALPVHICEVDVLEQRLVELDRDQSASGEIGLFLVYPSRRDISAKVRLFSEHLVDVLEKPLA